MCSRCHKSRRARERRCFSPLCIVTVRRPCESGGGPLAATGGNVGARGVQQQSASAHQSRAQHCRPPPSTPVSAACHRRRRRSGRVGRGLVCVSWSALGDAWTPSLGGCVVSTTDMAISGRRAHRPVPIPPLRHPDPPPPSPRPPRQMQCLLPADSRGSVRVCICSSVLIVCSCSCVHIL